MSKPLTCAILGLACLGGIADAAQPGNRSQIVHDAEYYILEAQNGKKWAAEDKGLNVRLAELRKKHGAPPNIVHVMWDDTPVGEVGIPEIQKMRGWETPNINRLAGVVRDGAASGLSQLRITLADV